MHLLVFSSVKKNQSICVLRERKRGSEREKERGNEREREREPEESEGKSKEKTAAGSAELWIFGRP